MNTRVWLSLVACFVSLSLLARAQSVEPIEVYQQLLQQVVEQHSAKQRIELPLATQMLGAASKVGVPQVRLHEAQMVFNHIVWEPVQQDAFQRGDDGLRYLQERLKEIEQALEERGVPEPVRKVGRLYECNWQYRRRDFAGLQESLDALRIIADPHVAPGFRAIYWNLAGLLASEQNRFATAVEYHERALDERRRAGLTQDEAESLNNLAYLYLRLGDYSAAQRLAESSVQIYRAISQGKADREIPENAVWAEMNFAKALEGTRDYERSLTILQSLDEQLSAAGKISTVACYVLNNLAICHYNLGNFGACEESFRICEELALVHEIFPETDIFWAELTVNRGWVALMADRTADARQCFERALQQLHLHHPKSYRIAEVQAYLARVLTMSGEHAAARQLFSQALAGRRESLRDVLNSPITNRDRLAFLQQLRVHPESLSWPGVFDSYLELAPELAIDPRDQYAELLFWKGLLNRSGDRRSGATGSERNAEYESQRAKLRQELLHLRAESRRGGDVDPARQVQLEEELDRVDRLLRIDPTAGHGLPTPPSLTQVADGLTDDELLVDLIEIRQLRIREEGVRVRDDRHYVAFLVRPDETVERLPLGRSLVIDTLIDDLHERCIDQGDFEEAGRQIDEEFGANLRESFQATTRILISPDGEFARMPWSVLPGLEERYWIQELSISTIPSAHSLVERAEQTRRLELEPWLIVGGVDYGPAQNGRDWVALPSSQSESQQIAKLLTESSTARHDQAELDQLLAGTAATKAAVLKGLETANLVHLATHGDYTARDKDAFAVEGSASLLESALVFANANVDPRWGADSLLLADELAMLDLRHVNLMVLSACETGLGQVRAGQGSQGLVSALDAAGVGSLVTALWKVDDRATSQLMEAMYRQLLADPVHRSPAAALRAAQLEFLEGPETGFQHPYFWAAWQVSGRP